MVSRAARTSHDEHTHPSSHTPYSVLNTPEKDERLRRLHLETRKAKRQIDRQKERITASVHSRAAPLDRTIDSDLRCIVSESRTQIFAAHPEGSF